MASASNVRHGSRMRYILTWTESKDIGTLQRPKYVPYSYMGFLGKGDQYFEGHGGWNLHVVEYLYARSCLIGHSCPTYDGGIHAGIDR